MRNQIGQKGRVKRPMGESTMKRKLKHRHLQFISLGGVIGSGYFLGTGYVLEQAGPAAMISYLLGGLIVLAVMLCLAELAVEKPLSGSFVVYARENISATWACGVGWSYWVTWVSYVPSEMIAAGIIMNGFFPEIGTVWWAVFFGGIVTILNLFRVDKFGESEFWLSLIKVTALVAFSAVALLICLGVIGGESYIGTRILLGSGGFAPHGYASIALTMVIILVNFQGTEIIGLAAGETADPARSIPTAVRNVTWRIIALYIVPITLLISILPWDHATLSESAFAAALTEHGFSRLGALFSFVVLTAAISCSNSGLYGAARTVHALAVMGMAPRVLEGLSKQGVPSRAIYASIMFCWGVIAIYAVNPNAALYTYLLALSGFSGAMAWISICWSQYRRRRKCEADGTVSLLRYRMPLFPYVTLFGIWAQVLCLAFMIFTPELRSALYLGIPMLVVPMILYRFLRRG